MAGELISIKYDDKELARYINAVTKEERRGIKSAYRAAVRPIMTAAKRNIKSNGYNIAGLDKAVRGGAWKNSKGGSTYIRTPADYHQKKDSPAYKNFLLLFFEGGTKSRMVKKRKRKKLKTPANRGAIKAGYMFTKAVKASEQKSIEAFERTLTKAIEKAK